jgi:hypothetical protein
MPRQSSSGVKVEFASEATTNLTSPTGEGRKRRRSLSAAREGLDRSLVAYQGLLECLEGDEYSRPASRSANGRANVPANGQVNVPANGRDYPSTALDNYNPNLPDSPYHGITPGTMEYSPTTPNSPDSILTEDFTFETADLTIADLMAYASPKDGSFSISIGTIATNSKHYKHVQEHKRPRHAVFAELVKIFPFEVQLVVAPIRHGGPKWEDGKKNTIELHHLFNGTKNIRMFSQFSNLHTIQMFESWFKLWVMSGNRYAPPKAHVWLPEVLDSELQVLQLTQN